MITKPPQTRDDRGNATVLLDPEGSPWPLREDARLRTLAKRLQVAIRPPDATLHLALFAILASTLFGALAFWIKPRMPTLAPWITPVIYGTGGLWVGFALRWLTRRQLVAVAPSAVDAILDEGICPSCLYNLHGLPTQPDGRIVCPECGGAWLGSRLRRSAPFNGEVAPDAPPAARTVLTGAAHVRRTTDDRGREVPLVRPRLRHELRHARCDEHRARLRSARAVIASNNLSFRLTFGLPIGLLGAASLWHGVSGAVAPWNPVSGASSLWGIIGSILFVGLGLAFLHGEFSYGSVPIVRGMKQAGCCPSCGAALGGRAVDADGCVVCNECLAAWRPRLATVCACGYDLKGLRSRSDGRIECPECGAEWAPVPART